MRESPMYLLIETQLVHPEQVVKSLPPPAEDRVKEMDTDGDGEVCCIAPEYLLGTFHKIAGLLAQYRYAFLTFCSIGMVSHAS